MIPPEPVSETFIVDAETADIVIVGAGHSGVLAARAALEADASVILLEKSKFDTLNVLGAEIGTFNSKFARERGVPEYDPIDLILEFQKRSINRCNTSLIRQFAYNSGETFDWFLEPLDDKYRNSIHLFMHPKPKYFEGEISGYKNFIGTMIFNKRDRNLGLPQAIKDTILQFEENGGISHFGMTAEYLEKSGDRVTGVVVKDLGGAYHRFNAKKGVLLAAGDFSANKEMVFDLLDEFCELSENMTKYQIRFGGRDGSGIRMGIWAGGHIQPAPRGGMSCSMSGRAGHMGGAAFLKLNSRGKRFTNEGIMGLWAVGLQGARQPEGIISSIWDSNWREDLEHQPIDHLAFDISEERGIRLLNIIIESALKAGRDGFLIGAGADPDNAVDIRISGDTSGRRMPGFEGFIVYGAQTLDELADYLGYEGECKQNFLNSVARYNELCHKGRDEDFAKDARLMRPVEKPPFFATPTQKNVGSLMVTVAGLVVDENQQVVDDDLNPIPGLFATGNCSGEIFPIQYSTPIAGSSIGSCHTLGRMAGTYISGL